MGLIYVNPEGPNGNPDPLAAARDIRETFAPHGDERRGDRRADRRRPHLRQDPRRGRPDEHVGPEPEGAPLEEQGLGWKNSFGTGKGARRDHQRPRGHLDRPRRPSGTTSFFENLFGYEWELTKSPAGAHQWQPKDGAGAGTVPGAHDPSKRRAPTMLTTDLALRFDPVYEPISRRFLENPDEFADAFARAWFKLTHRDMGPIVRYLGPEVPAGDAALAGPGARRSTHELIDAADVAALKEQILASGLSVSQLVSTAWASASTFRGSDKRGGANGARIRLEPQSGWEVNDPDQLADGAAHPGGHPGRRSTPPDRRQAGLARRPDRARRLRRRSSRRPRTPASTSRCRSRRAARTRRRSRPTSSRSPRSSRPPTGSATTSARAAGCRPSTCWSTGRTC